MVALLPQSGTKVARGSSVELYLQNKGATEVLLPDLTGKTIKEVETVVRGYGLVPVINGSGLAYRQNPLKNTKVEVSKAVSVWFASSEDIDAIVEKQRALEKELATKPTKTETKETP